MRPLLFKGGEISSGMEKIINFSRKLLYFYSQVEENQRLEGKLPLFLANAP